jgi:hypothetical protein
MLPQVQPDPDSDTDENSVRMANVEPPPATITMLPSTSTPAPGKQSTRRKMNRRSASFSSLTNKRVSVFNIPPPPPFQPPQQLKEAAMRNRSQLSLEIPKVTQYQPKKKSPSLPVPSPPAEPPFLTVRSVDLIQKSEPPSIVKDEIDDPVRTLASVLSESPTDIDLSTAPPPPPFNSIVINKPPQHLTPPPRTHSIIGHTIPSARKSSLLAINVYRAASSGQDDHETNATQAFTRLTGQRAPVEVLHVGSSDGNERFDRNATIKALSLMRSLELSMTVGCHITQRLYVPKNLW